MKIYRLGVIGFGNVGQGFAEILRDHGSEIEASTGARFLIVAVNDVEKGCVAKSEGFTPSELLNAIDQDGSLKKIPGVQKSWDALEMIRESDAEIIVELSFTNFQTGQPAIQHVETALRLKKHVVTTNKGPIALDYSRLMTIAKENQVHLGVEGTVMSGTPSIHLGMQILSAAGLRSIQGIFNGTTNFILSQMEGGATYQSALSEAQKLGYAEADPTGDVEGYDAAGKVLILANLLMNAGMKFDQVERRGITGITAQDVREAQVKSQCWKLVGTIEISGKTIKAGVKPVCLPKVHPLANVPGATNAITYTTDLLGDVTLIGPGAGRVATGFAVLSDLLAIHQQMILS